MRTKTPSAGMLLFIGLNSHYLSPSKLIEFIRRNHLVITLENIDAVSRIENLMTDSEKKNVLSVIMTRKEQKRKKRI